ncbi:hypothetical protein GCM10010112_50550 [Actinoplanes lobatus]|uniref:Cell division protein FtsL n=1 Tax=Actinoplanes lobatus TaxID=113568 RepID=A0A7W7MGM9_9ACTN|nr:hypothetical protein [Actinoplanes lobatus]MBB4749463.1 hypothetical protein [Actinoplanes lobatus]GGN77489.1 hypothetical protein GCM10010112_50550 [Actinoplanes lobatus]GIE38200.1 hypothetical protein Alo02nite_10980 [Actinoplanes lobatus]
MSERSEAPRPGGRSAQPRDNAGVSRDAETGRNGVRGARRSSGSSDTRRSGIRGRSADKPAASVDGATALNIEVTGDAPPITGRARLWVAPPLPIRAPRATFAAAMIAVVLVGVVGILLINTKTVERSFRLDALRKEKVALDKRQQELDRQLVEKSGPGNLAAAARRLGLVPAEAPAVIWLPEGTIVRTPVPGKGDRSVTASDDLNRAGTPSAGAGE